MARKRCLPTDLSYNPKFVSLSSDTVRLIYMLIILDADDEGRRVANVSILGRRLGQPPEIVERALPELEQQGFLQCYEVEGESYYSVCDWRKLQTLSKPTLSEYPAPPSKLSLSEIPQGIFGEIQENSLEEKVKEKRREKEFESEHEGEGEKEAARSAASADPGAKELSIEETTKRVAVILKLAVSPALSRIVKDFNYRTGIDLITQAELAREWADTQAERQTKVTAPFFRRWVEREARSLPNSNNLTEEELQRRAEMEAYEASCEAQL